MAQTKNHTDIVTKGVIGRLPPTIQPYFYLMRLDRPIGTWLLLLPAWWSILYTGGLAEWQTLSLFALGALVMRSAGCVVNDLWDRDFDGKVERTQSRPLAAKTLTIKQALSLLFLLLCVGFSALIQLNELTIVIGMVSLVFVAVYPLMKRWTWWPQAFLGLTFNFGALMGWSAVTGELTWQAWTLYASGFFWTLGYDTIYAMQDREDDALIGIKSTARLFTDQWKIDPRIPCIVFYGVHFALLAIVFLSALELSWVHVLTVIPFLHLVWQCLTLFTQDQKSALARFQSNRDYGLMVCGVILFLS